MPISARTGKPDFNRFLARLAAHEGRNAMLAALVAREFADPLSTRGLVLSHRVGHIKELAGLLTRPPHSLPASEVRVLYGGQGKRAKADGLRFAARVTLSTYAFLSEGVDFSGNWMLLATPRKDVAQSAGRIGRNLDGRYRALLRAIARSGVPQVSVQLVARYAFNPKARIIDVDERGYALARRLAFYARAGAVVREEAVRAGRRTRESCK